MTTRYDQLLHLIDKHKPSTIVEVGVHRGARAVAMTQRALRYWTSVRYIGFDVFETLGQQFQDEALNGKGMPTEAEARRALARVQNQAKARGQVFDYEFIVGDTRETLHAYTGRALPIDQALAFIDGDHRIDAIRGDYAALEASPIVVFDDYYVPDGRGLTVDLTKYGANAVVDELRAAGRQVEILPAADPCKHGGLIKLAVVRAQ